MAVLWTAIPSSVLELTKRETCVVYTQVSPMSAFPDDRRVPVRNLRPGPGDLT
ncbi:unnamed protein product, partial [Staurois parvus]